MNPAAVQRLRINTGRYCGEGIDLKAVLEDIHASASRQGWNSEVFFNAAGIPLYAYHRPAKHPRKQIYFSAGIHGDEPAGPLAVRELVSRSEWPVDVEIWLCPCLNPSGLIANRRENALGIDLNRDYRHLVAEEVRAHIAWLDRMPKVDMSVLLHEDWEADGFYLYELNPRQLPSLAPKIIQEVGKVCPIETASLVDGLWEAKGGIIQPNVHPDERPQWAEAVYLITHKSPQSYTLEAPSDYPLEVRVRALVTAVYTVLREL